MRPARLHHADAGISEVMHHAHEPIFRWDKVSVKDGDEFTGVLRHPFFQRARFEALAIVTMDVGDVVSEGLVALNYGAGNLYGFVGGVIKDLNVKFLARIL